MMSELCGMGWAKRRQKDIDATWTKKHGKSHFGHGRWCWARQSTHPQWCWSDAIRRPLFNREEFHRCH